VKTRIAVGCLADGAPTRHGNAEFLEDVETT